MRLAGEGADVIVLDVCAQIDGLPYPSATKADLDETIRLVELGGRRALPVERDVRDLVGMREEVDAAVTELGGLDIVVANAGVTMSAPWTDTTPEMWDIQIGINLTGAWHTVMVGAPHLVRRGGGSIVLISSAAGLKVQPYMVPYMASKFGVTGLTKAFAAELAKDNIRVNSIHPTGTNTPMGGGTLWAAIQASMADNPRPSVAFTNMLPVDRIEPEDVANAVLFLASDEAASITSLHMTVDAGVTSL